MYIYIHIPFCNHICTYCDFPKMLYDKNFSKKYLERLEEEIKTRYQNEEVTSIYIGGGTPTSLEIDELKYLLEITQIFKKENLKEFTIESNIENLSSEKIKLLKDYGINRLSLGVQSFQEKNLKTLGRYHTKEMVKEKVEELKKIGISNISIDYIYGISEKIEEVEEDINTFLNLNIPHISCYSLIIEKNTILSLKRKEYIDEEKEYQMYKKINSLLEKNHYQQYEISNYSLPSYQSIHNLNYWNNGSYYGFGLGAVSYLNDIRISNTKNFSKYLKKEYIKEKIKEDRKTKISNEFILGLRKREGIDINIFQEKYHESIFSIKEVGKLLQEKKLVLKNNHLFIPSKYLYLSNEILINFIYRIKL